MLYHTSTVFIRCCSIGLKDMRDSLALLCCCLDELDDGHLGVVSLTGDGSENSCVSSVAVGVTIGGGIEERVDELLVVDPCHGLTAGVQVSALSELDHVVDVLADGTGADEGGLDASVSDGLGREGAEEGLALVGRLSELLESLAVGDHFQGGGASGLNTVHGCDWLTDEAGSAGDESRGSGKEQKEGKDAHHLVC